MIPSHPVLRLSYKPISVLGCAGSVGHPQARRTGIDCIVAVVLKYAV
jgi:hypothetical protein